MPHILYIDLRKALTGNTDTGVSSAAPKTGENTTSSKVVDPKRKLTTGVDYEYASSGPKPPGNGWEQTSGKGWRRPVGSGGGRQPASQKETQSTASSSGGAKEGKGPFSPDPESFKNDTPEDHYNHIKFLESNEGADPKLLQMHRQLIDEKTKDFSAEDHANLASKLRAEGQDTQANKHDTAAQSIAG